MTVGLRVGVEHLKIGDAVFGLAPGCFGPSVVLPGNLMVPMPPGLAFVDAATLPTVFVTVYAALGSRGLQMGEKVVLHDYEDEGIYTCLHLSFKPI